MEQAAEAVVALKTHTKAPKRHDTPEAFKCLMPKGIMGCYIVENKPKKQFSGYYPTYVAEYMTRTVTEKYGDDAARQLPSLWKVVEPPPPSVSPLMGCHQ